MIIHTGDAKPVRRQNPLPVGPGRHTNAFQATAYSNNATRGNGGLTARAAPTGQSIYVTDLIISVGSAMNVQVEDSDETILMEQLYLAANTTTPIPLKTPMLVASAKALKLITNIAANISVFVAGYEE